MKKSSAHCNFRSEGISRRDFCKGALAGLAVTGVSGKRDFFGLKSNTGHEEIKIKEYRTLGRTGFKVSDIGFGAPQLTEPALLGAALDAGINYIDTAEEYRSGGSEITIGEVIKNRDRKKIFITTKLIILEKDRRRKIVERVEKCLSRLQTNYVDCLMMHMPYTVAQIKHPFFHKAVGDLKARGRVRFVGLSNHGMGWEDSPETMEKVCLGAIEDGRFDMLLFVYNFLQREEGERILRACRENQVGAALMKTNPVVRYLDRKAEYDKAVSAGRKPAPYLEKVVPELKKQIESAEGFMKEHKLDDPDRIRDAAVRFVLNHPAVSTACLTIKNFEDLDFYVHRSGGRFKSQDEMDLALYESSMGKFYCRHACGRCESQCPHGVPINTIMRYYHYLWGQSREATALSKYAALPGKKAEVCAACPGHCQPSCPHGISIQSLLVSAHRTLCGS